MASYTSDAILFLRTFEEQNFSPKAISGQRAGFIAPELFEALRKYCGLYIQQMFGL